MFCISFSTLSTSDQRGIVVPLRAGGWFQTLRHPYLWNRWTDFSVQSFMELSRPEVVQRNGHLSICSVWSCPWAKNLSNLIPMRSRLETAGWVLSIRHSMELSRPVVVQRYGHLHILHIWACPWARTYISETIGWIFFVQNYMELSRLVVVQHHGHLPIWPTWASLCCPFDPVGLPMGRNV